MPTPLELLTDPVAIAIFAIYLVVLAWETLLPARALPRVPGWRLLGALAFVAFFFVSSYLPLLIGDWLLPLRLVDAAALDTLAGALLAFLTYELLLYGWHRWMHESDALFLTVHQMHHSAERLDVPGAFWFSPLDMTGFTIVSTLTLSLVGVSASATTAYILLTTLLSVFQHANIKTPRWLGYIVQRPESHSYHHERGVHAGNYSDFPLFDIIFGTFKNPDDFAAEVGFYDGASARVGEMLAARDVSSPLRPSRLRVSAESAP